MSTPTTMQAPAGQTREQGTHHFVLSLEIPGERVNTFHGSVTPRPGKTRQDIFDMLRCDIANGDIRWLNANVLFFSLEPNQL